MNKTQLIGAINDLLEKSNDVQWSITYMPSTHSYSIHISDDNPEERACHNCKFNVADWDDGDINWQCYYCDDRFSEWEKNDE